jgi:hypothetical protein
VYHLFVIGFQGLYPSHGLGFIMEVTQDSRDKDTSGFTSQGVWFRPPTPPSSSSGEDFSKFKIDISPRFITPPLLWDIEEMYGATKGPCQYLKVVGTIELDDFI